MTGGHGGSRAAQSDAGTAVALGLLLALQIPIMPIVILGPNLPQLFRQFGALPQADLLVPLIMTAPSLGIALLAPLAGVIADRIGHRRLLVAGLALLAVAGPVPLLLERLPAIVAAQFGGGDRRRRDHDQRQRAARRLLPAAGARPMARPAEHARPLLQCRGRVSAGRSGTLGWREPFALNAIAAIAFLGSRSRRGVWPQSGRRRAFRRPRRWCAASRPAGPGTHALAAPAARVLR